MDVKLGKFNVLIGANASGKSNFVQIFKFLRDIVAHGLANAISMQGGVEYLRNINIGSSNNMSISVTSTKEFKWAERTDGVLTGLKAFETTYEFALKFNKRGSGFKIVEEKITQKCDLFKLEKQKNKITEKEQLGKGKISIFRNNGKLTLDAEIPEGVPLKEENLFPKFLQDIKLSPRALLIDPFEVPFVPFLFLIPPLPYLEPIVGEIRNISIYDFDPKLPKRATPITGKAELEEDASNLAIIIKNILSEKRKKRTFFNLIKELLPFIEDLDIEKFADKSLLFKLKETYFKDQYLPASLISDGTINITALIVALYFEMKKLSIIEEPERNIHPYLISKIVNMMKEASEKKQIIVTTHNPEIVKHAGLENLLLIHRDEKGFSRISRPSDKEQVKVFLENDIGIEELYVQNLLE